MVARSSRSKLGDAIRQKREARGWRLEDLSRQLKGRGVTKGCSVQHLSQVERGNAWPSPELVHELDDLLEAEGRLLTLLRDAKVPVPDRHDTEIEVTAHLFYPAFLASNLTNVTLENSDLETDLVACLGRHRCMDPEVTLYFFPFQVVVAHATRRLTVRSITDVALWRVEQISQVPSYAQTRLDEEFGLTNLVADHEPYCFTCFVVEKVPWTSAHETDRAVQLLANPSILSQQALSDYEGAIETERNLLFDDSSLGDSMCFTIHRSHFGWASWAAVAIHEVGTTKEAAKTMVSLEIQLQALWSYSSNVDTRGEAVAAEFGCEFLEQALRRARRPRPTEHTSTRLLREALARTSRIADIVKSAVDSICIRQGEHNH